MGSILNFLQGVLGNAGSLVLALCTDGNCHSHPLSLRVLHVLTLVKKEQENLLPVYRKPLPDRTQAEKGSLYIQKSQIPDLCLQRYILSYRGAGCVSFLNLFLSSECVLHCM